MFRFWMLFLHDIPLTSISTVTLMVELKQTWLYSKLCDMFICDMYLFIPKGIPKKCNWIFCVVDQGFEIRLLKLLFQFICACSDNHAFHCKEFISTNNKNLWFCPHRKLFSTFSQSNPIFKCIPYGKFKMSRRVSFKNKLRFYFFIRNTLKCRVCNEKNWKFSIWPGPNGIIIK